MTGLVAFSFLGFFFCFRRSPYLDALLSYQTQLYCVLADSSQEEWKRMSSKYLLHGKCMDASAGEYLVLVEGCLQKVQCYLTGF